MRKISQFISSQASQMRIGGWLVIQKKSFKLAGIIIAIIPLLLVRLLRPFVLIRFGFIRADRIGHFVLDQELYLCEREVGIQNPKSVDFFFYRTAICNDQLKRMINRTLRVFGFVEYLYRLNGWLPFGGRHTVSIVGRDRYQSRDIDGLLTRTRPHLSFTDEENRQGKQGLVEMGVPSTADYICFHARDSAYLKKIHPNEDMSYHDYRDCNILNYIPALERMALRGIYSVRMGAVVKEKLNTGNAKIIDYASQQRTELLDIYLSAHCRFFLGCGSGIDSVASVFRRPVVYTNLVPLEHVPSSGPRDLTIPKKMWLSRERRFLGFREILESGVGRYLRSEQFRERGIEVVGNTADEIVAVTLEMDERLKGTWTTTPEDEDLQRRFWSLFQGSHLHGAFQSRIGADFLRQNRELL